MLGKIAAAPAAHPSYLSSPATATLYGKILGFVLWRPSQDKPDAIFMQPLQCIVQRHVANLYFSTHMATPDDNKFQCHLQLQTPEIFRPVHTGTTSHCRTQRRNPLHRRLVPLYTVKYTTSYSSFLPNTSPMQHLCSNFMHFAALHSNPASLYFHGDAKAPKC